MCTPYSYGLLTRNSYHIWITSIKTLRDCIIFDPHCLDKIRQLISCNMTWKSVEDKSQVNLIDSMFANMSGTRAFYDMTWQKEKPRLLWFCPEYLLLMSNEKDNNCLLHWTSVKSIQLIINNNIDFVTEEF